MVEINIENKTIIGLASILAGGGHNALRDFLAEELKQVNNYQLEIFTHSDKSYNFINDTILGNLGKLYNFVYNKIPNEFPAVSSIKLVKECEDFINKKNPQIVISTNFGVASAFGLVRKIIKKNFINIYAIPDRGRIASAGFPTHKYLIPDYVIVFDEETKIGIVEKFKYPADQIIVSGYGTTKSVKNLVAQYQNVEKEDLVNQLNNTLDLVKPIQAHQEQYLILGGAGGIINKSFGLLEEIIKYQKKYKNFAEQKQFFVVCGLNEKFYNKLMSLNQQYKEWKNIIPLPWLNKDEYTKLKIISTFPLLFTVAPATVNDLLETNCGPLLICNSRKGQELPNVDYVIRNNLGVYKSKNREIITILDKGFDKVQIVKYQNSRKLHLSNSNNDAQKFVDFIAKLSNTLVIPKRKRGKLINKINLKVISPKVWLSILFLTIPTTIIFSYTQFKKQKVNIRNLVKRFVKGSSSNNIKQK